MAVQQAVSPPGQKGSAGESLLQEAGSRVADDLFDDIIHQAASSDSSAEWFSAPRMQLHAQLSLAQPAAAPSRKRGRPRRYDTTLPLGESEK